MSYQLLVGHGLLHAGSAFISTVTRTAEYTANWANPNVLPSAEKIIELGIRGFISQTVVDETLLNHGVSTNLDGAHSAPIGADQKIKRQELWNQVFYATQEMPTVQEFLTFANRMRINDRQLDLALQKLGFYDIRVREDVKNLRYEIPSSSDLVRFSVRHVFEPDLIERLGYNDEFRPILDLWHRFQGLNYPIFSGPFAKAVGTFEEERGLPPGSFVRSYADAGLEDPTWAQAFWWAHWVLPSPTQGYEMYFRLRPDRDRRFDAPTAAGLDFGLQDLNLLLRANDYPPFYRGALAAIAHRVPGLRFLRQLRATEVFDKGNVKELLLRQGYSPGDAEVLAESVERNDRDVRRRSIEQQAKGQLAKYWELGIINKDEYRGLLEKHGLTPQDAAQSADLAELQLQYDRVKRIIEFVRRQFIKGQIDKEEAAAQMRQAGLIEVRINQNIDDWSLEVQSKHKEIAAQKAVQWACKGIISVNDLRNRLRNLGYKPQDVEPLIAESIVCSTALAARAVASAGREQEKQQRLLKQQQKDAARAIVEARRQLSLHGTPAQLRKWYCEGHIGELEMYSRLRFLGWPDADITRLIGDCKSGSTTGKGGQRGGSVIGGQPPAGGP